MQPFKLSDISTGALVETLRKYTNALYTKKLTWEWCDVCRDVHELYEHEIEGYYVDIDEEECKFCPLYEPGWCESEPCESKLNLSYHVEQSWLDDTNLDAELAWERALTEYLQWISIELVRRQTEMISNV
jgi:hypothetical protein